MNVSVLIRNLNYGHFLNRAIASALDQDYPAARREIIVVDDGSTDESPRVLAQYAGRIRLIAGPRRGAIAALNAAVHESQGDAFTLIDADDWAEPRLLSALAAPLQKDPQSAFSYCDYFEEGPGGEDRRRISTAATPFDGTAAGFLHRRSAVERVGFYDEELMFAEYDLLARVLKESQGVHIPEALYHYVRHGANMTGDPARVAHEIDKLRKRHGPNFHVRSYGIGPEALVLRPAHREESDARMILNWRNDPVARAASFQTTTISWEVHWPWYLERLASSDCRLFVAMEGTEPVGMVRLDRRGRSAWEVSINLAPEKRYGGRGVRLLALADDLLRAEDADAVLEARIRQDNPASQAAFRKAGYEPGDLLAIEGVPARRWIKRRSSSHVS